MYYNTTTWVGVLCGNITMFGVVEDHLSRQSNGDPLPTQTKWYCHTAFQTEFILFLYPSQWVACPSPCVLELVVSGWHVPTLVFWTWLWVGGMFQPCCFGALCEWVACPNPGVLWLVVSGWHGLHGLDTNQDKISIFFKSWCPIDYQHWQLSAFNYLSSFKHCFFAKQKCNVCKQMPYLCFLMKQGYCGHHGAAIQSVEQEIDCALW